MHRADLTKLAPITEVHFADLMGEEMRRFVDKYRHATASDGYFVNFNPKVSDPRDKRMVGFLMSKHGGRSSEEAPIQSRKPDHGDPVGFYAYPMDYVIDHWHDIEYGAAEGFSFLRVLKQTAPEEKVLRLDHMARERFVEAMAKFKMEWQVENTHETLKSWVASDAMKLFEAMAEYHISSLDGYRINIFGKVLFALIQHVYKVYPNRVQNDEDDEEDGYKYRGAYKVREMRTRNQGEQNRLLVKAGYEVLLDLAETPADATIYRNEPEQVVFLTKSSFEVVEVIKMPNGDHGRLVNQEDPDKTGGPKLAGMVAKAMGDRIAEKVPADLIYKRSFKNMGRLRKWIGDQGLVASDSAVDVTLMAIRVVHAFITSKGRLIVIGFNHRRAGHVRDSGAEEQTHEVAYNQALIRPGEDEDEVGDSLRSWVDSMEKRGHRAMPSHSANTASVTVVAEPANIFGWTSRPDDTFDQTAQDVADTFRNRQGMTVKLPWKPITVDLLRKYAAAVDAAPIPGTASAAPASPARPQTTTPRAPSGTPASPAP
jgi:hypothetical protein